MTTLDMGTPTTAELDVMVAELAAGAKAWATMDLHERADLLRSVQRTTAAEASAWAGTAIAAKQVPSGHLEGEEWMSGPAAVAPMFAEYADTLHLLAHGQSALEGRKLGTAPGERVTVRILPGDLKDNLLFNGFTGDVWLQPGVTVEQARADAGLGAKRLGEDGGVGLVLGAGNISAIGPLDVAYELVAFNRASILKLNPTFQHLLPTYERALAPLIDAGLLRIVNGGAEVGGYRADHAGIDHVHIPGSARTHDAIVWGVGEEAARNRAAGTPKLGKEMTSELGGVSPIIVVPGTWSKSELRFQAEHVVTQRLHNGGHNCIGGQALILSRDWAQKAAFIAAIRGVLEEITPRAPWYPNGQASIDRAKATYPYAEQVGSAVLVKMAEDSPSELYDGEYFAAVLGITELPGLGAEFLANAVDFANERLDGTLGASVIAHPKQIKAMGHHFEDEIAELRYGTIGINVWTGVGFLLGGATWGAFPGHTLDKVGSGIGIVHNSHLIAHTERTVLRGPFHAFPATILSGELALAPRPPWFVTAKTSLSVGKALASLAGKRTWLGALKVVPPAMRG
jgi:acyl-CoA reductase-like NAD-dependent aldehyde dehydrogenase